MKLAIDRAFDAHLLPDPAALPTGCRFHPRCPYRFGPCDRVDPPLFPAGEPAHDAACLLLAPE